MDSNLLPRSELPKLDGNPLNFITFKNNFLKHIVPKVTDRKCYFDIYCNTANLKLGINYSNKGDAGFALATERLEREYGRPSSIADACKQRIKAAKAVKSNNPVGLRLFSDLLEQTLITLEDIRFFGSLSSPWTQWRNSFTNFRLIFVVLG